MVLFTALSKAWKTLENEEGYKKCMEIIEEAKERVDDMVTSVCGVLKSGENQEKGFKWKWENANLLVIQTDMDLRLKVEWPVRATLLSCCRCRLRGLNPSPYHRAKVPPTCQSIANYAFIMQPLNWSMDGLAASTLTCVLICKADQQLFFGEWSRFCHSISWKCAVAFVQIKQKKKQLKKEGKPQDVPEDVLTKVRKDQLPLCHLCGKWFFASSRHRNEP